MTRAGVSNSARRATNIAARPVYPSGMPKSLRAALLTAALVSAFLSFAPITAAQPAAPPARKPPAPAPRLGINLSGPSDWNTELPFVDVFRLSRPWISQRTGEPWGKGPPLALDAHGWVQRLEPGCWAETPLCTIEGGHYPPGTYTVLHAGRGKLAFTNARVVEETPGRLLIEPNVAAGGFFLQIRETDPADPVREIRVIMPGFEKTYATDPFHPAFLARWRGVACLRFMDWMQTNDSPVAKWSDRPTPADATFSAKGVPLEWAIDLSNRLGADPWVCVPHLADDDYVRRAAELVKAQLDPKRKVYVEYSNELWNGQFEQARYAGRKGVELGLGDAAKPWEAGWRYTAARSVEIFAIWADVFGGTDRLVRVLASQSANAYVSRQIVTFRDAYKHADALAIAPYVSMNVPMEGTGLRADDVATLSVERVIDYVEKTALPESIGWIRDNKKVADEHGLTLVAYEAGQHLVGVQGGENNEQLTKLLHAANAHPRMGQIYDAYLDAWAVGGGDLLCHFSSVGNWSKWGSWGALQYYDDDPARSPKFVAIMKWAKARGQDVNVP
jgi:hypothetical protein